MALLDRWYTDVLDRHLREDRQMVFLTGPRQVGKTTTARAAGGVHRYLNWDRQSDRRAIVGGPDIVAEAIDLHTVHPEPRRVVFDELHKFGQWKTFLKGFFDAHEARARIVVTGSARLGFFRRSGDSLMGRYFGYRMHPLSVAELSGVERAFARDDDTEISPPSRPDADLLPRLMQFGGFPEPFLKGTTRFYNRWRRLRSELLFRDDLRDLSRTRDVGQVEVLAELIAERAGGLVNHSNLAADAGVASDTALRWVAMLEGLFYCFRLRPWHHQVPKSLRKQPKLFLWDWSLVADPGARAENLVASHLLKAVQGWTDAGLGTYDLFHLRDKAGREVDFLVTRAGRPWLLVEVKSSARRSLNPDLGYFQGVTGAAHAFQLAFDMPYVEANAFEHTRPVRVPAATFLSQLV